MNEIGIHLSSYTRNWFDDVLPYIRVSRDIGYQGVEIPLMSPDTFDYQTVRRELRDCGLTCTCGTSMNPQEDPSSVDERIRQAGIKRLKKCIDLCAYLGSNCLSGVLYAPWGAFRHREEAQAQRCHGAWSLQEAADYGYQKGVRLNLEILNRYECYFMNTVAEGLEFLAEVGRENVYLHFDTFHAHIEEASLPEAIRSGGKSIGHVHLCDNNRAAPGSGGIDFYQVRDALMEIGYERYLMVETFVMPGGQAASEVCIWRQTAPSAVANARAAYEFVWNCLNGEEKGC